jgi:hypothetical protein
MDQGVCNLSERADPVEAWEGVAIGLSEMVAHKQRQLVVHPWIRTRWHHPVCPILPVGVGRSCQRRVVFVSLWRNTTARLSPFSGSCGWFQNLGLAQPTLTFGGSGVTSGNRRILVRRIVSPFNLVTCSDQI